MEYLVPTYNIFVLLFALKFDEKSRFLTVFNRFTDKSVIGLVFGTTLYSKFVNTPYY